MTLTSSPSTGRSDAARARAARRRLARFAAAGGARQVQRENTALAQLAGDRHFAAGLPGEAEHLRQAEPGAMAGLLGREERFEDAFELIRRNAAAGVGDGYRNIA